MIIRPNIENSKQIYSKKLRKDEFFGEYSFFTGKERLATAEAHSFANLYKITRADFIKTIADFPEDFEQYHFMRDKVRSKLWIYGLATLLRGLSSCEVELLVLQ